MSIECRFRLLESIHTKGVGPFNEDAFGLTPRGAIVIDGATTLADSDGGESGGQLLAETVRDVAMTHALHERDASTESWLMWVVSEARRRLAVRPERMDRASRASAAAAFIWVVEGCLAEFRLFGDCFIVAGGEGAPQVHSDERLLALDSAAVGMLADLVRDGSSLQDARAAILPTLERHRALLNRPEGYPSLTLDGAGIGAALGGIIRLDHTPRLLLASDGFVDAVELFHVTTWAELLDGKLSLSEAEVRLRKAQTADPEAREYPRLKLGDDATAMLIEVEHEFGWE